MGPPFLSIPVMTEMERKFPRGRADQEARLRGHQEWEAETAAAEAAVSAL